jgi:hypothetical protein
MVVVRERAAGIKKDLVVYFYFTIKKHFINFILVVVVP